MVLTVWRSKGPGVKQGERLLVEESWALTQTGEVFSRFSFSRGGTALRPQIKRSMNEATRFRNENMPKAQLAREAWGQDCNSFLDLWALGVPRLLRGGQPSSVRPTCWGLSNCPWCLFLSLLSRSDKFNIYMYLYIYLIYIYYTYWQI